LFFSIKAKQFTADFVPPRRKPLRERCLYGIA
jgi:hypothetical protein